MTFRPDAYKAIDLEHAQNGFIGSFDSEYRDESPNADWFSALKRAQRFLDA